MTHFTLVRERAFTLHFNNESKEKNTKCQLLDSRLLKKLFFKTSCSAYIEVFATSITNSTNMHFHEDRIKQTHKHTHEFVSFITY